MNRVTQNFIDNSYQMRPSSQSKTESYPHRNIPIASSMAGGGIISYQPLIQPLQFQGGSESMSPFKRREQPLIVKIKDRSSKNLVSGS